MPRTKPNDVRRKRRLHERRLEARRRLHELLAHAQGAPAPAEGQQSTPQQH